MRTRKITAAGMMKKKSRLKRTPYSTAGRRRNPAMLLAGVLALICSVSVMLGQAKPVIRHTVDGVVVNGAGQPVSGAVVYLENPTSLDVRSYLTDAQGQYHFSQIAPQTDYEVWAEQNGVQSKHKFISQFSSHVHFHFRLKITPEKTHKFLGIF